MAFLGYFIHISLTNIYRKIWRYRLCQLSQYPQSALMNPMGLLLKSVFRDDTKDETQRPYRDIIETPGLFDCILTVSW